MRSRRGRPGAHWPWRRRAPRSGPAALLTLALAEAERAHVDRSLELLDEADQAAADLPSVAGLVHGQRGVLLLRLGDLGLAREHLSLAVGLLADRPNEQARALLNRGVAELYNRDFRAADTSFRRSAVVADRIGNRVLAAKAISNLGEVFGRRGDLPAALQSFQEATDRFGDDEPILRAGTVVDSGFVLLAAGLLSEAESELLAAAKVLAAAGVRLTEAEAWLTLAEIALIDERLPAAQRYGRRRAARGFARRGSSLGALLAEAVLIATASPHRRLSDQQRAGAEQTSTRLAEAGLTDEAERLRLRVARRLAGDGRTGEARRLVADSSPSRHRALQTRLLDRTVRAEIALAEGDRAEALGQARAGLSDLQRHQSRLGSHDLQTSVVRHGVDLARIGLADAVASGRASQVLRWLDRTRALATRLPPVRPPEDDRMADLLESLRHMRLELRQEELDPSSSPAEVDRLRQACRELERAAGARERQLSGPGDIAKEADQDQVREGLRGAPGGSGTLVSIFDLDDQVHALVLGERSATLHALGPVAPVADRLRRARADLDVLALSSTPPAMRSVVLAALRSSLTALDAALWQPLAPAVGDGPVALVPTGALATLPWTLLPGLRGRPITLARAPGAWLRGRTRAWSPEPADVPERVVFATGPRVDRAAEEVRSAADAWRHSRILTDVAPARFLSEIGSASVLHVAAHGSHDADNPLFSSIELEGGLVFGHDLIRLHRIPRHVVLSACDLGLATVRPGGETLGMTAALLHGGAGSVVAGVARVGDDVACDVAVAYHQRLSSGERPSYALANALADLGADGSGDELAPLTCFGAGW